MSKVSPDDLLSREEVAKYTGYNVQYLHNEASAGLFITPFKKIGQVGLYRRQDVDAWKEDRAKFGRPRPVYVKRKRG